MSKLMTQVLVLTQSHRNLVNDATGSLAEFWDQVKARYGVTYTTQLDDNMLADLYNGCQEAFTTRPRSSISTVLSAFLADKYTPSKGGA